MIFPLKELYFFKDGIIFCIVDAEAGLFLYVFKYIDCALKLLLRFLLSLI